jgi:outer membrane receptor for ferrienterochelin and colicin
MHDVQRRAWRKLALACGAAALALSAQAAHAAEAASVSEVVVTGDLEQTLPQAIAKSGSRLTVITSEQIEAGNYLDVGQALEPRAGPQPDPAERPVLLQYRLAAGVADRARSST